MDLITMRKNYSNNLTEMNNLQNKKKFYKLFPFAPDFLVWFVSCAYEHKYKYNVVRKAAAPLQHLLTAKVWRLCGTIDDD